MNNGFNSWVILIAVAVVAMALLGFLQYALVRKTGGRYVIKKQFNDIIIKSANIALTVIFIILLTNDSWRGIIQMLDNHLAATDSPVWSIILFPIVVFAIAGLFAAICHIVEKIASLAKIGLLYKRIIISKRNQ